MLLHNLKLLSFAVALAGLLPQAAYSYDILKRSKLVDDKLKTQEMLRPFGHDFIFDVGAFVTPDSRDLMDDADTISNLPASATEQEIVNTANTTLSKYYNKENLARVRVNLGMPIFSFTAFDIKWSPNLRADVGATFMFTPTEGRFTFTSLIDSFSDELTPEITAALKSCNFDIIANGAVIVDECQTQGAITATQKTALIAAIPEIATLQKDTAVMTTNTSIPVINLYAKADLKIGAPVEFTKGQHWFGSFFIGGLGRTDVNKSCDAIAISLGTCDTDFKNKNTVFNAITELKMGYKNSNYSVFAAAEEIKLAEMSKEDSPTPMAYGSDPLIRIHGSAFYRLWIFSTNPFIGTHARSGYGFGDAYYFGVDWGSHVWGDRLGITLRTMLDKEHFTLAARFKLWLMHIEATSKLPAKSEVDGVKVAPIWGANIRFFI